MDLPTPISDGTVTLHDGRLLAHCEWGAPDGEPLLFMHGNPGSRFLIPDPAEATTRGVRLVTVDRPGFGDSTPSPSFTLRGFAGVDVRGLVDHLGLRRLAVIGFSAGGPAALAIGLELEERVSTIGLAASVISEVLVSAPEARNVVHREEHDEADAFRRDAAEYQSFADEMDTWLAPENAPPPDRHVFADLGYHDLFLSSYQFGLSHGVEGAVFDERAAHGDWDFQLSDISRPVIVWHGTHDPLISRETADYYASHLPNAKLVVWDDEAHLGIFSRWGEALDAISGSRHQASQPNAGPGPTHTVDSMATSPTNGAMQPTRQRCPTWDLRTAARRGGRRAKGLSPTQPWCTPSYRGRISLDDTTGVRGAVKPRATGASSSLGASV